MNPYFGTYRRPSRVATLFMLLVGWCYATATSAAEAPLLRDITYSAAGGNEVHVVLQLTAPAGEPASFSMDNPARVVIDLPGVRLGLQDRYRTLDIGRARSVRAVEAGGRTRVVIGLTQSVPFDVRREGDNVVVVLDAGLPAAAALPDEPVVAPAGAADSVPVGTAIEAIDFRRGEAGEARIIVDLSRPGVVVDMQERGNRIYVDFLNASVPPKLERRLDVTDFATPVTTVDAFNADGHARLVIKPTDPYEHLAYQTGDTYTIEVKPVVEVEDTATLLSGKDYTGEKLSFNFQNIEVRAVLQLIADFTSLNIVASDSVTGNITLRLKNVPWDQALDIILKARGLGMRRTGNVLMIAPNEEIAARDKQELEAIQQQEQLVPLRTDFFPVNYAKATELAALLGEGGAGVISERGSVTVDERTNTLMVKDTADRLEVIAKLVEKLDVPIRQVLIESRIVIANDDFSRSLGVRAGVSGFNTDGNTGVTTSGSSEGSDTMVADIAAGSSTITVPALSDRLNIDLPVPDAAGTIALAILGSNYLVDLELSALQQEGKGEVVSSPRVVTANQKQAVIKQGVQIPYVARTSDDVTTQFKDAVLSLQVTPQITPDDRVIMDLSVSKDSQGEVVGGIPTINTRSVSTQVLVDNGATVVLGGIYEQTRAENVSKVPLLGDLPILGNLFRSRDVQDDKAELLIFVTPKILKEDLTARFVE